MTARKHLLSLLLLIIAFPCVAQDGVVTIEGTRIRGDQEVPTVLYLVPGRRRRCSHWPGRTSS